MFHIYRLKNKEFGVVLLGSNGKVLSSTEGFKRKKTAFDNIRAQCLQFNDVEDTDYVLTKVQDDTTDNLPDVWQIDGNRSFTRLYGFEKPKYIPGKNPKKKSRKGA